MTLDFSMALQRRPVKYDSYCFLLPDPGSLCFVKCGSFSTLMSMSIITSDASGSFRSLSPSVSVQSETRRTMMRRNLDSRK